VQPPTPKAAAPHDVARAHAVHPIDVVVWSIVALVAVATAWRYLTGLGRLSLAGGSETTSVLTTVIVVAAFDPIKRSLTRFVDARFKEAPDAIQRWHDYGTSLQAFLDLRDATVVARRLLHEAVAAFEARGSPGGSGCVGGPCGARTRDRAMMTPCRRAAGGSPDRNPPVAAEPKRSSRSTSVGTGRPTRNASTCAGP
jgi:pimeloyl-ACP methyl ester carboxylesterase